MIEPCPLCGRSAHAIQPIPGRGRPWNIACGSGSFEDDPDDEYGCGLVLFGGDEVPKRQLISRWNSRVQHSPASPSMVVGPNEGQQGAGEVV